MKYSVKLIIRHTVETGEVFLEESIIMLDADSFDDAYLKAEQYVEEYGVNDTYQNMYGKTVKSEVISFADCFSVFEDDVMEVYSSFIKCREDLPEEAVMAFWEEDCSRKDLLPLRQWPDPEHPEELEIPQ